jgi:protein-tyrosine phosphatase
MVSFDFITERIATGGGIVSVDDITTLVQSGITHIIDMCAEFNDSTLNDTRVIVCWLPQQDDGTPRDPVQVRKGVMFALGTALAIPNHKVLCHCAAGVNRGPLETYAILRSVGLKCQEAIDRIRNRRPVVAFYQNQVYMDSVEKALQGE